MTSSKTLAGATVCITGASSGIGQAIAQHLGSNGANVFMMGRNGVPMEESADLIRSTGGSADVATFDVTDLEALSSWIDRAATSTGRLDVMVNNAGFGDVGATISDGDPAMWKAMLETNVLALAVGCQAAVKAMRSTSSQGNIINISSVAAHQRESGVYGATKHAVNCINSTLRKELQDEPIRVTSIMPGVFATNFTRNVDRAMVEGIAGMAGITKLEFDEDSRLPQHQIDQIQQALAIGIGDVMHIAKAVEYIILQPSELNIEEIIIRPQKSLLS
jgi:NADP-dependent 3-hydroxy acid dehydrogenase YdfG